MRILVLPVSGGGFVTQLAIIQHLCEIKYIPDLVLASSGGNVAAYIAAAANWKWPSIERISRELSQDLFVKPWNQVSSLSMIIGYFKGNIHNKGSGIHDFFRRYFTPETITKYEIWTGTYNKNRQRSRLFCNRSKETSIVDISYIDYELTQCMEPIFTNGDMNLIGDAGVASASIPSIVPAQKIYEEDYIDGGVAGASPLTIMQEPILKYVQKHQENLHIVYVNSVDLSNPNIKPGHNLFDTWRQTANSLIKFQTVIDRLAAYELLRCHNGNIYKEEFNCNYENMKRINTVQDKISYSMLEIYPINHVELPLSSFTGNDVVNAIRSAYGNCKCRLWWIIPESITIQREINEIVNLCKQN